MGLAEQVCEQLSTNLLNEGRTLYVDNFYTNYNLAHKFLQKKAHVVGTVRSGRKKLAKEVHVANLKQKFRTKPGVNLGQRSCLIKILRFIGMSKRNAA